jgi:hypothetical protein
MAVTSRRSSLISQALGLYVGGWGGQVALYGVTFILALIVALMADGRFDMSIERTALLVVMTTIALLFLLPLGYVYLRKRFPYDTASDIAGDCIKYLYEATFSVNREALVARLREHPDEETSSQLRVAAKYARQAAARMREDHAHERAITEVEERFKEVFLSVFMDLFLRERERQRYEDAIPPGERDCEAAVNAADRALTLFIRYHNIEVQDIDKKALSEIYDDMTNIIGRRERRPRP